MWLVPTGVDGNDTQRRQPAGSQRREATGGWPSVDRNSINYGACPALGYRLSR